MSKNNNIFVYCQGCGKSFNGNKNQQGKITSGNLTRHLSSPLGMLCRELYKASGLIQESTRKGGKTKYKLESSTTKNKMLLEKSKKQFKNLDQLPLNKRVQEKAGFTNATLPMGKHETFGKIPTTKRQKKRK